MDDYKSRAIASKSEGQYAHGDSIERRLDEVVVQVHLHMLYNAHELKFQDVAYELLAVAEHVEMGAFKIIGAISNMLRVLFGVLFRVLRKHSIQYNHQFHQN